MRILVTGSDGFLGRHLCRALEADGHQVRPLDRRRNPLHDLLKPRQWQDLLEGVDLVYHLAALADVQSGRDQPLRMFEQNTQATLFLLEMMRTTGVSRLIFTSSAAVYGVLPHVPIAEDGPMPVQLSLYGASKLAAEGLLTAYAATFGLQVGIVRLVQLLGPGYRHGHLWDVYQQLQQHPDYLVMKSDGLSEREYLHVSDAVSALQCAAAHPEWPYWVLNAGGGDVYSIRASVQMACQALGFTPTIHWTDGAGWAGDVPIIHVQTQRLRELGWEPIHPVQEAIRDTVLSFAETPVH